MRGALVVVWVLPLWATVDAAIRPGAAFRTVRHRKVIWLLPGPLALLALLVPWWWVSLAVALVLTAWYMAKVRDLVKVAEGMLRG